MSRDTQDIDVSQLIEVICGFRKETYRFERLVSLMTFSGWLRWPHDSEILSQVRLISAANVITAIESGILKVPKGHRKPAIDQLIRAGFPPLQAAAALVKPAVSQPFMAAYDKSMPHLFDAATVAYFFVRCDRETPSPSYNRALFFIERGGFVYDFETGWIGKSAPYKYSKSQIKFGWGYFAVASSFSLAAELLPLKDILFLPPDREYSSIDAKSILDNTTLLRRYFSLARSIHERLLQTLDHRSRDRVDQFTFPDDIKPCKLALEPFEADQIAIIKSYHVRKQS